jgi:hypothetical protein
VNIAEHSLKVAVLEALVAHFTKEYKAARTDAETAYRDNKVRKVTVELPNGDELGDITIKQPKPAAAIDEEKLLAWVAEHTPAEVEEYLDTAAQTDQEVIEWARVNRDDLLRRRIRPVWRAELEKVVTANDGYVISGDTGEATKVAEVVKHKATGAFALPQDRSGENKRRLIAALLAGELSSVLEGVTSLSIAAPTDGGDRNE